MAPTSTKSTIFHISHWKAGSQWVREILRNVAPERFVSQEVGVSQILGKPIVPGKIYGSVYLPRHVFNSVVLPGESFHLPYLSKLPCHSRLFFKNWFNFVSQKKPIIKFVVIRDLRDTLISLYFSLRYSHKLLGETQPRSLPLIPKSFSAGSDKIASPRIFPFSQLSADRKHLAELTDEEGLLFVIENHLPIVAEVQSSWLFSETRVFKYEDLITHQFSVFREIVDFCGINVHKSDLEQIIRNNDFQQVTGRIRGKEIMTSHHRKAVVGDWRNYFTERVKSQFCARFGKVLIAAGYESDLNW